MSVILSLNNLALAIILLLRISAAFPWTASFFPQQQQQQQQRPVAVFASRTPSPRRFGSQYRIPLVMRAAVTDDELDDEYFENEEDDEFVDPVELPQGMEEGFSRGELEELTVSQLKQQLRLRGLKVSGLKQELIDRLLPATIPTSPSFQRQQKEGTTTPTTTSSSTTKETTAKSKAEQLAEEKGKELIDVTDYLEEDEKGKNFRSWKNTKDEVVDAEFEKENEYNNDDSSNSEKGFKSEVWGTEARIVDDYEGRKVVVDCLSQTVVEFKGSNQSYVSASVVASRDALRPFLAGGNAQNNTAAEARLREIQLKREKASKIPTRFEDDVGMDEGDETGLYANVVERDYSDWGKFTLTGAQLSASEVQGVLLLPDVYGAFSPDIETLAEKIAFECQPVVVMTPDLFR